MREGHLKKPKHDKFVKSRKTVFLVIPPGIGVRDDDQAGIQYIQGGTKSLDSGLSALSSRPKGFRRSDDLGVFLRVHQVLTLS